MNEAIAQKHCIAEPQLEYLYVYVARHPRSICHAVEQGLVDTKRIMIDGGAEVMTAFLTIDCCKT